MLCSVSTKPFPTLCPLQCTMLLSWHSTSNSCEDFPQAGHPALEVMVQLPPGSEPPSVPTSLTLTAGDKCAHLASYYYSAGRTFAYVSAQGLDHQKSRAFHWVALPRLYTIPGLVSCDKRLLIHKMHTIALPRLLRPLSCILQAAAGVQGPAVCAGRGV